MKKYEHSDGYGSEIRVEKYPKNEIMIGILDTMVQDRFRVYLSSEKARELAHFILECANQIEAEQVAGLIIDATD